MKVAGSYDAPTRTTRMVITANCDSDVEPLVRQIEFHGVQFALDAPGFALAAAVLVRELCGERFEIEGQKLTAAVASAVRHLLPQVRELGAIDKGEDRTVSRGSVDLVCCEARQWEHMPAFAPLAGGLLARLDWSGDPVDRVQRDAAGAAIGRIFTNAGLVAGAMDVSVAIGLLQAGTLDVARLVVFDGGRRAPAADASVVEALRLAGMELQVLQPSVPAEARFDTEFLSGVVSIEPPILYTREGTGADTGVASFFGDRFGGRAATFIWAPSWTLEEAEMADSFIARFEEDRRRNPNHRFAVVANTDLERAVLHAKGVDAVFVNHNMAISEDLFRPLPNVESEFHAIYNARFFPMKRHELAEEIPSVGYVGYAFIDKSTHAETMEIIGRIQGKAPAHQILNPMRDGLPTRLSPKFVNAAYARGDVGLCLSAVEGGMYASIEYLLAGLPVVSTPSKGGRESFFDEETCIIVPPEPGAVAEAVAELRSRKLSRAFVRERTLAMMKPHRDRFMALLRRLGANVEGAPDFEGWPFPNKIYHWDKAEEHLKPYD